MLVHLPLHTSLPQPARTPSCRRLPLLASPARNIKNNKKMAHPTRVTPAAEHARARRRRRLRRRDNPRQRFMHCALHPQGIMITPAPPAEQVMHCCGSDEPRIVAHQIHARTQPSQAKAIAQPRQGLGNALRTPEARCSSSCMAQAWQAQSAEQTLVLGTEAEQASGSLLDGTPWQERPHLSRTQHSLGKPSAGA